ncbi:MAG: YHS domain-containing protein [Candidatus Limnocylindrales bacterium]
MATAIDPVCGMDVETEGAPLRLEHAGTTYYFCGRGCLLEFGDAPERFVGPEPGTPGQGADERQSAGPPPPRS